MCIRDRYWTSPRDRYNDRSGWLLPSKEHADKTVHYTLHSLSYVSMIEFSAAAERTRELMRATTKVSQSVHLKLSDFTQLASQRGLCYLGRSSGVFPIDSCVDNDNRWVDFLIEHPRFNVEALMVKSFDGSWVPLTSLQLSLIHI